MSEVSVTVTKYAVSAIPEDNVNRSHFQINVEYRGAGKWAVCRYGQCLDATGAWDYESIPSEREDDWLATHRFDLDTALTLARTAALNIRVGQYTVERVLAEATDNQKED